VERDRSDMKYLEFAPTSNSSSIWRRSRSR
jgi:hypothetical protein